MGSLFYLFNDNSWWETQYEFTKYQKSKLILILLFSLVKVDWPYKMILYKFCLKII